MVPGTRFPAHRHHGRGLILVLAGCAQQEEGPLLWPGDSLISDAGSDHALRSADNEPLLFAVVLEDGLDWSNGGG